ncbi:hypothetical protein BDZ85DRAFT_281327 [Elsinoe ampelina]|uniref:Uncharacterized protein n=1 Tax=Elsinoe ampelina TaxID=302913 RepID=A0A6A6GCM8_9PEZI|nr:hypothetical protein BDZ85DRAFT_281327 [Elsinoe ampelina]
MEEAKSSRTSSSEYSSDLHSHLLPQTEDDLVPSSYSRASRGPSRFSIVLPWLICVGLLILLTLGLLQPPPQCPTTDFWKPNELLAAKKELPVSYHDVVFDATLEYNSSHLLFRPVTEPPYVGDPSAAIDEAWEELMGDIDIFVTPKEREEMGIDLWLDPDTGLHVGLLSVMHDLHCVNMIRKSLSPEYYPDMHHYTTTNHIEHCLDMLRLSLMCTSDMTLIPTKDSESRPFEAVFDTKHSCRDYSAVRDWSKSRGSADPKRYPANAAALKERERMAG